MVSFKITDLNNNSWRRFNKRTQEKAFKKLNDR